MSEIAQATGISKGAVYLQFESKEHLYRNLVYREIERLLIDIQNRIDADPQGGTISGVFQHSFAAYRQSFFSYALAQDQLVLQKILGGEQLQVGIQMDTEFIRLMQGAGVVREDVDPAIAAHLIAIVSQGLLTIEASVPSNVAPPFETTMKAIHEMIECYLAPAEGGNSEAGKAAMRQLFHYVQIHFFGQEEPNT